MVKIRSNENNDWRNSVVMKTCHTMLGAGHEYSLSKTKLSAIKHGNQMAGWLRFLEWNSFHTQHTSFAWDYKPRCRVHTLAQSSHTPVEDPVVHVRVQSSVDYGNTQITLHALNVSVNSAEVEHYTEEGHCWGGNVDKLAHTHRVGAVQSLAVTHADTLFSNLQWDQYECSPLQCHGRQDNE